MVSCDWVGICKLPHEDLLFWWICLISISHGFGCNESRGFFHLHNCHCTLEIYIWMVCHVCDGSWHLYKVYPCVFLYISCFCGQTSCSCAMDGVSFVSFMLLSMHNDFTLLLITRFREMRYLFQDFAKCDTCYFQCILTLHYSQGKKSTLWGICSTRTLSVFT